MAERGALVIELLLSMVPILKLPLIGQFREACCSVKTKARPAIPFETVDALHAVH